MIDPTGIDMITSAENRTSAILDVLALYLDQAEDGGDTLPTDKIATLIWQAQLNMSELRDGITEVTAAIESHHEGLDDSCDLVPTRSELRDFVKAQR